MFSVLLFSHSIMRWLLVLGLFACLLLAFRGYTQNKPYSRMLNLLRHWTATVAHLQLLLGILLYVKSSLVKLWYSVATVRRSTIDPAFFAIIHMPLMVIAVVIITIGSAKAKREKILAKNLRFYCGDLVWPA